jgi:hypothetical protein
MDGIALTADEIERDVLPAAFALPVEYQGEVGTPPGQREQSLW